MFRQRLLATVTAYCDKAFRIDVNGKPEFRTGNHYLGLISLSGRPARQTRTRMTHPSAHARVLSSVTLALTQGVPVSC